MPLDSLIPSDAAEKIHHMSMNDARAVHGPPRDTGLTVHGKIVWEDSATGSRWTSPTSVRGMHESPRATIRFEFGEPGWSDLSNAQREYQLERLIAYMGDADATVVGIEWEQ